MSDVTEPRSQPDKGGARPSPSRRAAPERGAPSAGLRSERTRNFSSLRKKSCASLPVGFFFFSRLLRLLSSFPLPLLPFESFFFFFLEFDRMADSTSVSINFFSPPLPHLNKFKAPPPPAHQI